MFYTCALQNREVTSVQLVSASALPELCVSVFIREDEDHCAGSYWADWTVSGQPGTAAGSRGDSHRQEPRKTRCAS